MNIIKKHKNIIIKLSIGVLFLVLIAVYIFNLNIRKIFSDYSYFENTFHKNEIF